MTAQESASAKAPSPGSQADWVHATAIVIGEDGVLIRGASGAGKSTLARRLVELAQREGLFACLTGDDRVRLRAAGKVILAAAHPEIAGQIEVRGQGVFDCAHESPVRLSCVIDLADPESACGDLPRLPDTPCQAVLAGNIALPCLKLPAQSEIADRAAEALAFVRRINVPAAANPAKSP